MEIPEFLEKLLDKTKIMDDDRRFCLNPHCDEQPESGEEFCRTCFTWGEDLCAMPCRKCGSRECFGECT